MYTTRARLFGGLSLLAALHAGAADKDGNYAIWGLGQSSCNQFVTASQDNRLADYKHYVAGYLTGINRMTPGRYGTTGNRGMKENLAVMLEYCTRNRMDSLEQALQGLLREADKTASQGGTAWGRTTPVR